MQDKTEFEGSIPTLLHFVKLYGFYLKMLIQQPALFNAEIAHVIKWTNGMFPQPLLYLFGPVFLKAQFLQTCSKLLISQLENIFLVTQFTYIIEKIAKLSFYPDKLAKALWIEYKETIDLAPNAF